MREREPVALLCLPSWSLVSVVWLFITMTWICLQFVIVVFPDYTHSLFLTKRLTWSGSQAFDTLIVFLKEYFKKDDFEKKSIDDRKARGG